eukprot:TRINITY_DN48567_c0_g1_i1.p1 TRINITY_DN48567_c0_g1~~TRINITY_DN48567_c0_g1_i1.p1  ORF type:complete len:462 (+),score=17.35 TRINITY_DN48567_c0_g1_i1:52-1386(+)
MARFASGFFAICCVLYVSADDTSEPSSLRGTNSSSETESDFRSVFANFWWGRRRSNPTQQPTEREFVHSSKRRSFSASKRYCEDLGFQIASIHSPAEQTKAFELVRAAGVPTYLGGKSDGHGKWEWVDGSVWGDFTSYTSDGLRGTYETQLVMNTEGAWHDWGTGANPLAVLCQKAPPFQGTPLRPTPPPQQTDPDFVHSKTKRPYSASARYCADIGYQIASIRNSAEQARAHELIRAAGVVTYLGAASDGHGHWAWADGSAWGDFIGNAPSGLAGRGETRLVMRPDGTWHDWGTGGNPLGVLCRKIADPPPISQPVSTPEPTPLATPSPSPSACSGEDGTPCLVSGCGECVEGLTCRKTNGVWNVCMPSHWSCEELFQGWDCSVMLAATTTTTTSIADFKCDKPGRETFCGDSNEPQCVPNSYFCDGIADCDNGFDELNCQAP